MNLRVATPHDLDAIMAVENRSFPTDAWSAENMAAELDSPHGRYLVDEEDGTVIGYGGVRALQGSADADIQTIAFDAAHRGRGRGRALLRALLDEAVAHGAREVFLEVRADNPGAEGLYLSEGFEEIGRRPRYYQPDDVDAIVMRLDLRGRGTRDRQVAEPADVASVRGPSTSSGTQAGGSGTQGGSSVPSTSSVTRGGEPHE
ncbi:ribosomal protein S18-alanine N-acetyltransferase [Microbacterium sp. SD291]|uniref:ribosomal protein S18-alanine N-acetyltransferase n=1 Tax=Microbacterium sp. SD291 TaxID=2782007 RepID=UPI001A96C116|nr:ribosomal protein S18-alanine N-acetyltransferase [Microbacterium sp. SD291]MBO0982172.1 ribosomal protein S18-alanine N-acetyltransferase [Microbacterium sp. SD291]